MQHTLLKIGWVLIFISLGFAAPAAQAGGWAAVTLDTLPVEARAGEEIRIGFTVRQHGLRPASMAWEGQPITPYLTAENETTGELMRVEAWQEGPEGHFVVDVTFPSPGVWRWTINPEPFGAFPEYFEPLTVLPPAAGNPATRWGPVGLAMIVLVGLALAAQRGAIAKKLAMIGGAATVVLLLGGLLIWPALTSSAAEESPTVTPSPTEYGRLLYTAKGCMACHMYRGISHMVPGPVIGPNLTDYQGDPAYLRQWLRDPQAIKPDTQMPNLNLSDDEIEALIAFLSQ